MPILALDGVFPKLPAIGDFFIAPNAYVIGKVSLGRGVSVWYRSVLRGDTRDSRSRRRDRHSGTLRLPHRRGYALQGRARLYDRAPRALTGPDRRQLPDRHRLDNPEQRFIGDNCLVGAPTLVTEGKTIPAGSVVIGSPGKIVRPFRRRKSQVFVPRRTTMLRTLAAFSHSSRKATLKVRRKALLKECGRGEQLGSPGWD